MIPKQFRPNNIYRYHIEELINLKDKQRVFIMGTVLSIKKEQRFVAFMISDMTESAEVTLYDQKGYYECMELPQVSQTIQLYGRATKKYLFDQKKPLLKVYMDRFRIIKHFSEELKLYEKYIEIREQRYRIQEELKETFIFQTRKTKTKRNLDEKEKLEIRELIFCYIHSLFSNNRTLKILKISPIVFFKHKSCKQWIEKQYFEEKYVLQAIRQGFEMIEKSGIIERSEKDFFLGNDRRLTFKGVYHQKEQDYQIQKEVGNQKQLSKQRQKENYDGDETDGNVTSEEEDDQERKLRVSEDQLTVLGVDQNVWNINSEHKESQQKIKKSQQNLKEVQQINEQYRLTKTIKMLSKELVYEDEIEQSQLSQQFKVLRPNRTERLKQLRFDFHQKLQQSQNSSQKLEIEQQSQSRNQNQKLQVEIQYVEEDQLQEELLSEELKVLEPHAPRYCQMVLRLEQGQTATQYSESEKQQSSDQGQDNEEENGQELQRVSVKLSDKNQKSSTHTIPGQESNKKSNESMFIVKRSTYDQFKVHIRRHLEQRAIEYPSTRKKNIPMEQKDKILGGSLWTVTNYLLKIFYKEVDSRKEQFPEKKLFSYVFVTEILQQMIEYGEVIKTSDKRLFMSLSRWEYQQ